jgi:phosphate transport system permease protein
MRPLLRVSKARLLEKTLPLFSRACGLLLLVAIGCVLGFLFTGGWRILNLQLIFGTTPPLEALLFKHQVFDGLFPAVVGTFSLVILAVCWAIPIGIAAGIYLAEYATGKTKNILNLFFDILAGLPSIVVGLFGFSITIFLNKNLSGQIYPSLLISSIALAFLVLPYIIRTTQTALKGIPTSLRITALALGASKLQNIVRVLLPQSLSGISSGVVLATGRCAEDTAVIMLTGVVASAGVPRSLLSQYEALPFYIYYISSQYSDQDELATAYGAAIILLCICLTLFSLAFVIKKRVTHFTHFVS